MLFLSPAAFAQLDSIFCGTETQLEETQVGGYLVTSFGTVKALFIFIDFPDDTADVNNSTWPVGTGPNFLNDIVDSIETQNSGTYANVSTFFKDMSYGQFRMIGEAYYVQAPESLAWYVRNHPGQESHYASRDAIQNLDQTIDFADFDRWIDSPYNHVAGSDGILDMVFVGYRQWYLRRGLGVGSFPAEGWWPLYLPGDIWIDNNTRKIVGAHGVDLTVMIQYPRFEHVVHEFGHVWGLNHQYSPGLWTLMGTRRPNNGSFMNSFEREQLGWIAYHDITTSQTTSLRDFGTERDAYRLSLGNGEYFLLENHQRLSQYDDPDITGAKGLFVLRQYTSGMECVEASLKVEAADGRFDWSIPHWTIFPNTNVNVPVFKRESSLRYSGKSDKDLWYLLDPITQYWGCYDVIAKIDEFTGQEVYGSFYKGDGRDGFNLGYNTIFSPWSNPPACTQNGTLSSFGFEVLQSSDSVFDVQFFIGNPLSASPSKPQDLRTGSTGCNGISLKWARNLETDVVGYNIYRGLFYTGSGEITYTKLNSSPVTDTTYLDNSYEGTSGLPQNVDLYHRYRITAVDNQSKESVKSDYVDAYFTYVIIAPVLVNWNMTSVPNVVCDFWWALVYPTAIPPVYKYQSGYASVDTLDNLRGYWIKFPTPKNITYSGGKIDSTAMPVDSGWNIIGSISTSLDTSTVTYSPSGIRSSNFFKYSGGYVLTGTLEPGGGYWVKSSQAGFFILKSGGSMMRINGGPSILDLDRFTIADAAGRKQDMYVKNGDGDIELPPEPPEGAFNVRFQSGNFVQSIAPVQGLKSLPVLLKSLVYPITVSWNIKPENGVSYWLWQGTGANRQRVAIRDSGSLTLARRIADVVELEAQAGEASNRPVKGVTNYGMDANSPNPFNPSTQIRFQLPEGNNVVLTVFDVLGRKVVELVNGYLEPGYHSVTWDATSVASGIYFARFNVSDPLGNVNYSKVSKLVLMK